MAHADVFLENRYQIVNEIGRGGLSTVWKARVASNGSKTVASGSKAVKTGDSMFPIAGSAAMMVMAASFGYMIRRWRITGKPFGRHKFLFPWYQYTVSKKSNLRIIE